MKYNLNHVISSPSKTASDWVHITTNKSVKKKIKHPRNRGLQMPRSNRENVYGLPLSSILTVLNKDTEKLSGIPLHANVKYNL